MSVPYLAQAAEHEQLQWLGGGVMRILLDSEKTDGQLTMMRSATHGGAAAPVHVHDIEDEIVVLLQGSGWEITPATLAAAAAATGQTILGPPLAADQMMPQEYLTGLQAR
jgi:hypothetical protein